MPLALIKDSALRGNINAFSSYCREHGVEFAPHVKTTMSPEIWGLQANSGAWAATIANATQARTVRGWGVNRLLIANEIADRPSMDWVIRELEKDEQCEILFWVDSLEGVEIAGAAHSELSAERPLPVLIEVGHPDGRTGVRSHADAVGLGESVSRHDRLCLAGVAGFEGTIVSDSEGERRRKVALFIEDMCGVFEQLYMDGLFELSRPLISAGGSAFFDHVVQGFGGLSEAGARVVLRSGCYVTHDSGAYERLSPLGARGAGSLQPALEIWGAILSVPERGLAIAGIGRRDVSFDAGLPVPVGWLRGSGPVAAAPAGLEVVALNDQHAFVRDRQHSLRVGDLLGVSISHPCTTFDKWRSLLLVDDAYRERGRVSTEF